MSFKQIADFARSKIGCGYVYGATGWICNLSRRQAQAKQYPEYADTILSTCAKWDGKQCYDCAQLTRAAVAAAGGSLPSGATSQWNSSSWVEKGEIATIPADSEGLILYRQNGTTMQHTGVDVGNGRVVDSRGSSYGTMESDRSSYPWTHWARPRIPDTDSTDINGGADRSDTMIRQATVTKIAGASGSTVNLRKAPNGAIICTVPFGSTADILEESSGWSRFIFSGNEGWMQSKFLITIGDTTDSVATGAGSYTSDTVQVSRAKLVAMRAEIDAMLEG